ncbi:MAG: dihydroorotate oxidase [Candidatus ainarchaeum sp.]|nr:dihydroorotate oxidase [Candidatus ainarchaeum sp.]
MLKTKLGDIELDGVFTNGSGANDDSLEKLLQIAGSRAGFVTTKTSTFLPRAGNPGPRFYTLRNTTINSMGLPNPGYKKMAEIIRELKTKTKKPVFASMSGFDAHEAGEMAKALSAADVLELNLSCPNLHGKSQIIYDPEATDEVLKVVKKSTDRKIAVKVAPFLDSDAQLEFCGIAKKRGVDLIIAINTLGNAMYVDADREKIMLKPKWGGIGGEAIRMVGWGNVRRYYEYFKGSIPIVGCGGIFTGKDAFAYALAGASAFACASALYTPEGVNAFARMEKELEEELKKHNYSSLAEAVGKAKEF